MTTTPDPLDALKYAYSVVHGRLQADPDHADLADMLEALTEPLLGQDIDTTALRYSDGSTVAVLTELEPGVDFHTTCLPPGYPTARAAA